ncbi:DUF2059 domain-containing protein [Spirulina subsalsa]|uniref:DUF2059 domain-containing protein n=1 Tax=Spirulina subsalsa TaxID=54311 RepID=UPI0002D33662|nr:DUF2059 domain-containing protein [Spirulina subsalsa]
MGKFQWRLGLGTGLAGILLFANPVVTVAETVSPPPESGLPTMETLETVQESISPEKLALIQQLRQMTQTSRLFQSTLDSLVGQTEQAFGQLMGANPDNELISEEDRAEIQAMMSRITERIVEEIREKVDVEGALAKVETYLYNKYYTEGELRDLIAFYQTPTGQKTVQVMPQMTQDSMRLFNELILPDVFEVLQGVMMEELGGMMEGLEEFEQVEED